MRRRNKEGKEQQAGRREKREGEGDVRVKYECRKKNKKNFYTALV